MRNKYSPPPSEKTCYNAFLNFVFRKFWGGDHPPSHPPESMPVYSIRENCVFQTLRHYKNYIFCLQQATLLDSFQNKCIKNDNIPVKKIIFQNFHLGQVF